MKEQVPESQETLTRRLVYLSAERTLTSWIRTSLSLMALGFVIDRFGLILHMLPGADGRGDIYPRVLSTYAGSILIGMGVLMSIAAGVRYLGFALGFHRERRTGVGYSLLIGAVFSLLLAAFGVVLSILLVAVLP